MSNSTQDKVGRRVVQGYKAEGMAEGKTGGSKADVRQELGTDRAGWSETGSGIEVHHRDIGSVFFRNKDLQEVGKVL